MSRCYDTCCTGDRDTLLAVLLRTSTPRAKKAHLCANCGGVIFPGTVYVRQVALMDGEITSVASHDRNGYCRD